MNNFCKVIKLMSGTYKTYLLYFFSIIEPLDPAGTLETLAPYILEFGQPLAASDFAFLVAILSLHSL